MLEDRYSVAAQRALKRMDFELAKQIIEKVDDMKKKPFPTDAARCKDEKYREDIFKFSFSGYKILYELNFEDNVILIHSIDDD